MTRWREKRERSPPGTWRLLAPALLAWGCAALAVQADAGGGVIAAAGAAIAAALGGAALCGAGIHGPQVWRRRVAEAWRCCAVASAVLILLGASVAVGHHLRGNSSFAQQVDTGERVSTLATLNGFPHQQFGDDESAIGQSEGFGVTRSAWVMATLDGAYAGVPVVLWLDEPGSHAVAHLGPGSRVELIGTARPLEAGSMSAYGIRVDEVTRAGTGRPGWQERTALVSAALRNQLRAAAENVPGADLVPGFAVGDTSLVSDRLESHMKAASTVHVTAVSGSNIGLIVAAVVWMVARFGAGKRVRIVCAACSLVGFVMLVGPDPSVQRAALMAGVMLISDFGGRRSRSLSALGLAMLVMLLADPWQALQPGFALSVSATAGILLLAPTLERSFRRLWPFACEPPRWLVLPPAVAVSAQLACGPFLLLLQPGLPVGGILANCLIELAAPLGTGLGLISLLTLPLSEPLGHFCMHLASWPARWVATVSELVAGLPGSRWSWPSGWPGALLLTSVEAAALIAYLLLSRRIATSDRGGVRPWSGGRGHTLGSRVLAACLACGALGALCGPTLIAPALTRGAVPTDWDVVVCDIGQGDAILLRDSLQPDRVLLVDTGDDPEKLRVCLSRFGVADISLLVLTHDDRDHVGALSEVVPRSRAALVAPDNAEDGGHRPVLAALEAAGVRAVVGAAGLRGGGAGLQWEVLAPDAGARPADSNAASLVLMVDIRGTRVLLLADTGEDEQRALRVDGERVKADIVKIAHHGSRDQYRGLAKLIEAQLGLISVGAENSYGHPARQTLEDYSSAGTEMLRTDQHGSIAISMKPGAEASERLEIWLERAPR